MDSTQALADRLAIYLAAYKHYVEIKSQARLLDVTIFGESFARDIAEIAFGYKDLVNLNIGTNFPAVDLGSVAAACAIQVTITASSTKIVETQQKFLAHGLDRTYSKLKFIVLGDKQAAYDSQRIIRVQGSFSFDPDEDIYDLGDLFNILVAAAEPAKFEAFYRRLERELGSAIRPYLLGVDRPGQHLRDLLDAHDVRTSDAVQALQPFGVNRAIYSNNVSLAEAASKNLVRYVAEQFGVSDEWIDGTYAHIYSNAPGAEVGTDWRRSLKGAYDLIKRACSSGERLGAIIPAGLSLHELDATEDVVDHNAHNYERFFLFARKTNDFSVDRFRLVLGDTLSYRGCRNGIFLLFLAAEIHEIETRNKTYIDVYETPREQMMSCYTGDKFLVELYHSGQLVGNQKDYIYSGWGGLLKATKKVPSRLVSLLQDNLTEFVVGHSTRLPTAIEFT